MTESGQRLDKWLWFARMVKTRTMAGRLVTGGKVRVNRAKVTKPSRIVRNGDVITLAVHGRVRVLKIASCGARRGPASEAQTLYEDLAPSHPMRKTKAAKAARQAVRERGAGRPTKRDRRRMEAWTAPAIPNGE